MTPSPPPRQAPAPPRQLRALVTGGSRGLGRAICLALARRGSRVAFSYRAHADAAAETLAAINALSEGVSHQASVLDAAATARMVEDVEQRWGGVDVLVNNAGITQVSPFALLDANDWSLVMDTNVKGAFITTHAVMRGMIRRKSGCVLNIGSLAGLRVIDAPVHYSASKAALVGFTKSLAKEMSRHHVRVNCLAPGLLEEGVGKNIPPHRLQDYIQHCAMGRPGSLDEAAELAAFLVSDDNPYMTGEVVIMDGGL